MSRPQQPRILQTQSGFTMVELMVVIVILGLLGTMVGTGVMGNLFASQNDIAAMQVKQHHDSVKTYYLAKQEIPESLETLTEPDPERNNEPFIQSLENDPWGNAYQLRLLDGMKFEIISNGPDGMEDTEDDIVYPKRKDDQ